MAATGRLQYAALAGCLLLGAASSEAQPRTRQVLVLQSFNRGSLVVDHFTTDFRFELDQLLGTPVNFVQVVVGPTGFVGAPEPAIVDYIRSIFPDQRSPDLIVTVGGPAALFARQHRSDIYPGTPLLFASVDQRFVGDAPLDEKEAAVTVINDFSGLVEDILRLRPQTRQVFMIMGSGALGTYWRRVLDKDFKRFQDRLTFVWSEQMSLPEILHRCSNLPANAAIYYFAFGTDATGVAYADERVLADLHEKANAPLFAAMSTHIGFGVVGGTLLAMKNLSRNTASVAVRLLNGEPPGSIQVPPQRPGPPMFDWRELQRWEIAENKLPPGSIVSFRDPGLWQEFKFTVLSAAAALLVQSLLIVGLLYQRRARRRAEVDSRKNLTLAADASRRQTMSALTGSIAHDLVQSLTSMTYNAQAGLLMIDTNRAMPEEVRDILSDIESDAAQATQIIERHRTMLRSHPLDKRPIDLHSAIRESLALIAHDTSARQIEVTVRLDSNGCIVAGDQVLLQQVLVNLVMNAMDAMVETPPGRRRVTITTELGAADVAVSVGDTGTGLSPQVSGALFKPFVTTKPQGLGIGLAIAKSIVDAHGGTIDAHNNPGGGATFTVTLRRSETPGIVSYA